MPDYVHADITIGGELTIHQIGEIAKKLFEIDRHSQKTYTFGGLLQQIKETGEIFYEDEQAEWGEFVELEQYLKEQGIWFDRDSDHNTSPCIVYFRGTNALDECFFEYYDENGDVVVSIDPLVDARQLIDDVSGDAGMNVRNISTMVAIGLNNKGMANPEFIDVVNQLLVALKRYAELTKTLSDNFNKALRTYDVVELPDVTIINPINNKKLTPIELEQLRVEKL